MAGDETGLYSLDHNTLQELNGEDIRAFMTASVKWHECEVT